MADEVGKPAAYRDIAAAIRAGDSAAAGDAARALLEPATVAFFAVIDSMEEH
jgi:DNA-binding FadR family transcriptional regulator